MKKLIYKLRDRIFPSHLDLAHQQIEAVDLEINRLTDLARQHEELARVYRNGVARLRGANAPSITFQKAA